VLEEEGAPAEGDPAAGPEDRSAAIARSRRAVELRPLDLEERVRLGELLGGDPRDLDAAKKELYAAIALRPTSALPYRALGLACARAGRIEDAEHFFG